MGRWSSRLDRIEDRVGGGACPECGAGGQGPRRITMQQPGDPEPRPCGTCGTEPVVFTIAVEYTGGVEGDDEPMG